MIFCVIVVSLPAGGNWQKGPNCNLNASSSEMIGSNFDVGWCFFVPISIRSKVWRQYESTIKSFEITLQFSKITAAKPCDLCPI